MGKIRTAIAMAIATETSILQQTQIRRYQPHRQHIQNRERAGEEEEPHWRSIGSSSSNISKRRAALAVCTLRRVTAQANVTQVGQQRPAPSVDVSTDRQQKTETENQWFIFLTPATHGVVRQVIFPTVK